MEANKRTINDIFNGNRILEIPFFQRSYVWDEEQWERLLEDLDYVSKSNKPYFLGSVILKQQQTSSGESVGDKRILIDGQQRLTTLNILLKVLCLKQNKNEIFNKVFRLFLTDEIALMHNYNDIDAFNRVLNLEQIEYIDGSDNITRAYDFFSNADNLSNLSINNILTNIMFVGIDLGVEEDEQQIFDTINSLGVRLTTAELLKNYFFSRDDITYYEEKWRNVFEKDEESKKFWDQEITAGRSKRENIDLFFYSYLQIKIQDSNLKVSSEDKKRYFKVDSLFESYKDLISNYNLDKTELIEEINDYANVYRENIDISVISGELSNEYGIDRINAIIFGLETSTIIPYVLYVLKNVTDIEERKSLFEYLESFLMRRMVCHETTKNYNQFFTERLISNNILTKSSLKEQIAGQEDKINNMPGNDNLLDGFNNSKLVNKQTLGILYLLESKIRDRKKHSTSLMGLDKYSLEHIMPKKWENNWDKVDTEEDRLIRNRKLLTLGNLTILSSSLNSSIRDASWKIKKEGKGTRKGLNHFAAGLDTFSSYLNLGEWNEEEMEKRAAYLYTKATEVWKL